MRAYTILSAVTISLTLLSTRADQPVANTTPITPPSTAPAAQNNPNIAQEIRDNTQRWRDAIMASNPDNPLRQHLVARFENLNNSANSTGN
jgi:hypothetical protein